MAVEVNEKVAFSFRKRYFWVLELLVRRCCFAFRRKSNTSFISSFKSRLPRRSSALSMAIALSRQSSISTFPRGRETGKNNSEKAEVPSTAKRGMQPFLENSGWVWKKEWMTAEYCFDSRTERGCRCTERLRVSVTEFLPQIGNTNCARQCTRT